METKEMVRILRDIAINLSTNYESKKHGGYKIYRDDKIIISYDDYYPNIDVKIIVDGESKIVFNYSGHGYIISWHSGAWEQYVVNVLYPKALLSKEERDKFIQEKEEEEKKQKFSDCSEKENAIFKG